MNKQVLGIVVACALLMPSVYSMEGNAQQAAQVDLIRKRLESLKRIKSGADCLAVTSLVALAMLRVFQAGIPIDVAPCTAAQLGAVWQQCGDCTEAMPMAAPSFRSCVDTPFMAYVHCLKKLEQKYSASQEFVSDNSYLNATHVCEKYNPEHELPNPERAETSHINYYCLRRLDLPYGAPFEKISDEVIKECFDVDEDGNWHYKETSKSLWAWIGL